MIALVRRWLVVPVGYVGAVSLLLLSVVIVFSIVARRLGYTVAGSAEVSEILLVLLVFLALAYTQSKDGHVAIEVAVAAMPTRLRNVCRGLTIVVCLAVTLALFYGTAVETYDSYRLGEYRFGTTRFPLWPAKLVIAVGFFLLAVEFMLQLVLVALGRPVTDSEES